MGCQQMFYICNMVANILKSKSQWLRRCISAVLLLLFALSITPKKTLHDILVHHQDEIADHHPTVPTITHSGFHCDTDNWVAESPFTGEETPVIPQPLPVFIHFNDAVNISLHSITTFYFSLRGPPAIV